MNPKSTLWYQSIDTQLVTTNENIQTNFVLNVLCECYLQVLSGGVACNSYIRSELTQLAHSYSLKLRAPPPSLCTDNAVMIAWAGIENFLYNILSSFKTKTQLINQSINLDLLKIG
jgi:tRNA A37 threonylcarbamoyltransferase TsaD